MSLEMGYNIGDTLYGMPWGHEAQTGACGIIFLALHTNLHKIWSLSGAQIPTADHMFWYRKAQNNRS